jgi:Zn-dependent M28 family amino/carboxypeptidase
MRASVTRKKKAASLKWILGAVVLAGLAGAVAISGAPKSDFDGARAFDLLKRQCDFGPRPVGTMAHEKTRAYLVQAMRGVTDKTVTQDFAWKRNGKSYQLSDIIGVLNPDAAQKIMISAHWDTRPTADQDKTPANRSKPILGADDGASGVAVVLELARVLKAKKPKMGVIFMLFDGEDVGPNVDNMFLGARYFAKRMGEYKPDHMILIDMIGDSDLNVYKELNSVSSDRSLVQTVWNAAADLGYAKQFPSETKYNIEDDHIPVQEAGVPSIDLIDFDYPYWHTLQDTVDKCSPDSLTAVGRTLQAVVMNGL